MLSDETLEKLKQPLDKTRVKHRQGGGGMQLSYIEGHDVIDTANLIFGYGNWGVETIDVWQVTEKEFVKGYAAKVRLEIVDCKPIIGIGFNPLQAGRDKENGASPDSHDMAIKGAETDAMKRCFRNFGDQFGNSLYDKTLVDGQPKPEQNQPAPTNQNRPTTPQAARVTQNQPQQPNHPTPPPSAPQPAKTVTAPAPNQVSNFNPELATEQQLNGIRTLARNKKLDEFELRKRSFDLYGRPVEKLDKNDAGHFIKVLQGAEA